MNPDVLPQLSARVLVRVVRQLVADDNRQRVVRHVVQHAAEDPDGAVAHRHRVPLLVVDDVDAQPGVVDIRWRQTANQAARDRPKARSVDHADQDVFVCVVGLERRAPEPQAFELVGPFLNVVFEQRVAIRANVDRPRENAHRAAHPATRTSYPRGTASSVENSPFHLVSRSTTTRWPSTISAPGASTRRSRRARRRVRQPADASGSRRRSHEERGRPARSQSTITVIHQRPHRIAISSMSNTSSPAGPAALIGEPCRNPEARFLAFDHQLHSLGPALDHFVQSEGRGRPRITELSNILPSVVQPV